MALEQLEKGILAHAKKEAARVLEEAEQGAEEIKKAARLRAAARKKELEQSLVQELERLDRLAKARARMKARHLVLEEERKLIAEVYAHLLEKLQEKKGDVMKDLFEKSGGEFKAAKVYVSPKDLKMARALFKGLDVAPQEMQGGFILESGDSSLLLDCRFETLVERVKAKTLKRVAQELFG